MENPTKATTNWTNASRTELMSVQGGIVGLIIVGYGAYLIATGKTGEAIGDAACDATNCDGSRG